MVLSSCVRKNSRFCYVGEHSRGGRASYVLSSVSSPNHKSLLRGTSVVIIIIIITPSSYVLCTVHYCVFASHVRHHPSTSTIAIVVVTQPVSPLLILPSHEGWKAEST